MNFRTQFSLVLFLCFLGTSWSQEKDSVASASYNELKISFFSFKKTDVVTAKKYANLILQKAKTDQNSDEESIAHLLLADIENELGNYVIALQEADKTIAHSKKIQNKNTLTFSYKVKGSVYRNLGRYENAILYYLKVDSIAKVDQNIVQQVKSNHDIGLIKHELGKHEEAATIFLENLEKLKPVATNNAVTFLNTYIALTATYIHLDTQKASEYNKIIKQLTEKDNDKTSLLYYYLFEGKIHVFEKKYQEAQPFLAEAATLALNFKDDRNLFAIYRLQGKCFLELQEFDSAIEVLEKAKAIKVKQQFLHLERYEVLSLLANSYERNGQRKEALLNYEEALSVVEQNKEVKNTTSKLIEVGFDINYYKNKIKELTEILSKEQQSNQLLRYAGIVLLLILLIVAYRFQTQKRKNKEKFKNLLNHIDSLEKKQQKVAPKNTSTPRKISDEQAANILTALDKFEQNHGFLNSKTSLTSLAKKANTNTSYLSKIINTHKGQTFKNYITTLRINYALQRLKNDKQFRSYSIKGISEELGFKSEGSFSRAFKAQTGIYPSYFIKNITAGL
jgi:AraC-like DNA-binding protein